MLKPIVNLVFIARSILRSPIHSSLKRKIMRTEITLAAHSFVRRKTSGIFPYRICDYTVSAYSLDSIRFLHTEIFRNLAYFFKSTRQDPFILDCGSNIGLSILFFKALYPQARIIGFEPAKSAFDLLQYNMTRNNIKDVQLYQVALGLDNSMIDFYVDQDDPGSLRMSSIKDRCPNQKKVSLRQVRLSSFIDGEVDFLKLDVEGAEESVLQDLISSRVIAKIDQMVVEYHHHMDQSRDSFGIFLLQLERNGFGYQIHASCPISARVGRGKMFEDLQLYAYRKDGQMCG